MTTARRLFVFGLMILGGAGCVVVMLFAMAVPRHGHGSPNVPLTNERWEILSNTGFSWASIKATDATPPGRYRSDVPEADFRKLLKLLMPFETTTESSGTHYDYELSYQAGMNPAHIYVDLSNDDMRFWLGRDPSAVYRSRSRAEFLAAIEPLLPTPSNTQP